MLTSTSLRMSFYELLTFKMYLVSYEINKKHISQIVMFSNYTTFSIYHKWDSLRNFNGKVFIDIQNFLFLQNCQSRALVSSGCNKDWETGEFASNMSTHWTLSQLSEVTTFGAKERHMILYALLFCRIFLILGLELPWKIVTSWNQLLAGRREQGYCSGGNFLVVRLT